VSDPGRAREIDGRRELAKERQRGVQRRGRVVPHRNVERLGRDVFLSSVGDRTFQSSRKRLDDRWMEERDTGSARKLVGQRSCLLGRDIQSKDFDRDEAIARGFVCAKDGTESADTDLMQHPEGAERGRWGESGRIVSGQ
jgi:hypothetical protein